jgi:hypothetical protein
MCALSLALTAPSLLLLVLNVSHSGDNVFDHWIEDTNHLAAASPRGSAGQVIRMLLKSTSLLPSDDAGGKASALLLCRTYTTWVREGVAQLDTTEGYCGTEGCRLDLPLQILHPFAEGAYVSLAPSVHC